MCGFGHVRNERNQLRKLFRRPSYLEVLPNRLLLPLGSSAYSLSTHYTVKLDTGALNSAPDAIVTYLGTSDSLPWHKPSDKDESARAIFQYLLVGWNSRLPKTIRLAEGSKVDEQLSTW